MRQYTAAGPPGMDGVTKHRPAGRRKGDATRFIGWPACEDDCEGGNSGNGLI